MLLIRRAPSVGLFFFVATGACGGTTGSSSAPTDGGGNPALSMDSAGAQLPPMGASQVEAWLAQGAYKSWHGESAVHDARSPSPHGFNRIYSNQVINAGAAGTAAWPVGAAAVKELYASATDATPVGYAVYSKTAADSAGGANWYWYERVPLTSSVPHDAQGVVADGLGDSGVAMTLCVGCHVAAGSNAAHTPTPGGHDFVYTPVP